ncbi:conserved hypothetical protein [Thermosulfidibacter takaii ABI70S6]|uniref:PH domain-containing protein n=2 Tax=Thermosulfidibacter takaii TaxID=412593 RepID=A0A0S3QSB2_THET7|nr:conserved hypothetical protein [Thermosulfidibacter takaii ABI70S6]
MVIGAVVIFLTVAFFLKGKYWGISFGVFFLIPLVFILLFINYRFILLDDKKLCLKSIFGKRCFRWDEIESVETQRLGIRNTLWIRAKDKVLIVPLIFSNLEDLCSRLGERLQDRFKATSLRRSTIDLILLYLTALFLLTITLSKLLLR